MNNDKSALTPPDFLSGHALEIWERVLPQVKVAGIAAQIESDCLACYCIAVADLAAAEAEIAKHGLLAKSERGLIKNPACTLKNMAMSHILAFGREFGLTPSSRSRASYARSQNLRSQ